MKKRAEYDVLIVEDERFVAQGLARMLLPRRVRIALSVEEAMAALDDHVPSVVIVDYFLRDEVALKVIKHVAEKHPHVRRVIYSGYRDPVLATVVSMGLAHVVLHKPATGEQLLAAISG
jgi:ActR/RegA family two-component response regulator